MSPEANAILQRLQRVEPAGLSECIRELLERGEALEDAEKIIKSRLQSGSYVLSDDLARLLTKVRDASLYRIAKEQLFQDRWALLTLYKGGYPDPAIEDELVEILYQNAENDAEPVRRAIVEAIFEKGTIATIPVLEAILYDLAPTQHTKKAIANALFDASGPNIDTLLAGVVASSRIEFIRVVNHALEAVRERGTEQANSSVEGVTANPSETKLVANAHRELEQARDKVQSDPTYALVCLRRGAEAMGKHLYRHLGLDAKGKPANKMMLGDLQKPISESDAPHVFKICIQALQPFGNYASHDQDDQFQDLTPMVAGSLVNLYDEALRIYEDWLRKVALET